jgi:hypothetical protein
LAIPRGFGGDSGPGRYEEQINNVMILVAQSDKPEEEVKKLKFLDKLKQSLSK